MNRIKKVSRPVTCLLALLLCVMLLASTAFAAGGALGADRNGTPYTYVIGYMYSGSSQTVNTREIFTSPNNYDIWLCPVCGRDPLGNSQGTALSPNLYMPCYGYDIAAAGGDMSIRYALVRHRHNNGQLSNDRVYGQAAGGIQPDRAGAHGMEQQHFPGEIHRYLCAAAEY